MRADDKFEAALMNAAPLSAPLTTEQPILDIPTSAYFHGCVRVSGRLHVWLLVWLEGAEGVGVYVLGCVHAGLSVHMRWCMNAKRCSPIALAGTDWEYEHMYAVFTPYAHVGARKL